MISNEISFSKNFQPVDPSKVLNQMLSDLAQGKSRLQYMQEYKLGNLYRRDHGLVEQLLELLQEQELR